MERSGKNDALSLNSAVQEVSQTYGIPVISIGNLADLMDYIGNAGSGSDLMKHKDAVTAYRQRYGVT
jgi:orotate phosphoribosyltransferase